MRLPVREPKTFRQTFLTFSTIAPSVASAPQRHEVKARQPGPVVPTEIWSQILQDLPTIALKSIRLVCSAWADSTTQELFRVVYLDNFDSSWSRLSQLSQSPYACFVREIVWTPVYLSKKCLNADVWGDKYTNLLTGLTHSERAELHGVFRDVIRREGGKPNNYRYHQSFLDDSCTNFAALSNCRRVTLTDRCDIETRCSDPQRRFRIQRDKKILNQVGSWGLCSVYNPYVGQEDVDSVGRNNMDDMFSLADRLPSTLQLSIAASSYDNVPTSSSFRLKLSNVESMHTQVYFYHCSDLNSIFEWHMQIKTHLQNLVQFAGVLPNLRSTTIEAFYTDPGPEFNEAYGVDYWAEWEQDPDHSDNVSEDCTENGFGDDSVISSRNPRPSFRGRRLSEIDHKFDPQLAGFDRPHVDAVEAELVLGITKLPRLREFTLRNISLNVQSLLGWLANQPQLPESSMILRLYGNNILYGLDPQLFLRLLELLNVHLSLDGDGRTLYYETNHQGHTTDFQDVGFSAGRPKRERSYVARFNSTWSDGFSLEDLIWTYSDSPQELSDLIILRAATRNLESGELPTVFMDRPDAVGSRFQELPFESLGDCNLHYCCIIPTLGSGIQDPMIAFCWLDHPTYCRYERQCDRKDGVQHLILLLTARAYDNRYDEYGYSDSYYDEVEEAMWLEQMWSDYEQNLEQELLASYENEFLRLDITADRRVIA